MGLDEDDDEYVGSGCDEKEGEEEADDDASPEHVSSPSTDVTKPAITQFYYSE